MSIIDRTFSFTRLRMHTHVYTYTIELRALLDAEQDKDISAERLEHKELESRRIVHGLLMANPQQEEHDRKCTALIHPRVGSTSRPRRDLPQVRLSVRAPR